MSTTVANTKSVNKVEPPKIQVVNTLPSLANAEIGEMFLLISDSATGATGLDKAIHIRIATGWLRTAALTTPA